VLWEGKPVFIPFVASGLPFLAFGILWGIMDYSFIQNAFTSPNGLSAGLVPFFLLHLAPLWLGILNMARLLLVFNNTDYAVTNKRVLMRTGFWGIDFKAIDYDKIQESRVDVNPLEKMFGVGTIRLNTGMTGNKGQAVYDSISAIPHPYEVFKKLKLTTVDVKTDWNYPNKLRPSENPGYGTAYRPER
jgi:membrane protein YdbS with pleckstrin-like domain